MTDGQELKAKVAGHEDGKMRIETEDGQILFWRTGAVPVGTEVTLRLKNPSGDLSEKHALAAQVLNELLRPGSRAT